MRRPHAQWWKGNTPLAEWFAEAYSWCARYSQIESVADYAIYDYDPTPTQHRSTCTLIKRAARDKTPPKPPSAPPVVTGDPAPAGRAARGPRRRAGRPEARPRADRARKPDGHAGSDDDCDADPHGDADQDPDGHTHADPYAETHPDARRRPRNRPRADGGRRRSRRRPRCRPRPRRPTATPEVDADARPDRGADAGPDARLPRLSPLTPGIIGGMDGSVLWRAALLAGADARPSSRSLLGAALDKAFFGSWGWLAGPGAWAACALFTGAVLRLPLLRGAVGAALAGHAEPDHRPDRRALARRAVRGRDLRRTGAGGSPRARPRHGGSRWPDGPRARRARSRSSPAARRGSAAGSPKASRPRAPGSR